MRFVELNESDEETIKFLLNYKEKEGLSFYNLALKIGISETALVGVIKHKTPTFSVKTMFRINRFVEKKREEEKCI